MAALSALLETRVVAAVWFNFSCDTNDVALIFIFSCDTNDVVHCHLWR